MLLHIPDLLTPEERRAARVILDRAEWVDGRVTAGEQSALAKQNEQLPTRGEAARRLQELVLGALDRSAVFFSATLPRRILPPMFNRYGGVTNTYRNHVDQAVRALPGGAQRLRSDVSCTLFLAEPQEYDGGELVVEHSFGTERIKLPAGHLVLYPASSVHRVEPVTRGQRLASFFWVESMVRGDERRRLLFDMDQHLMRLRSGIGESDPAIVGLTGTYHNLLRMWCDT